MTLQTGPVFIGVAGETASGKSTFCRRIQDIAPPGMVQIVCLDSYYLTREELSPHARQLVNYDHPDAIDWSLVLTHVNGLSHENGIAAPLYDFHSHARLNETRWIPWAPIMLIEGILALYREELRRYYDYSIYLEASDDLRFQRRLLRDCQERGRTPQSVWDQWETSVRPMSIEYSSWTRTYATNVVESDAVDAESTWQLAKSIWDTSRSLSSHPANDAPFGSTK